MSAQQIWRDGGAAKQRYIRTAWPDLAEALDGARMAPEDIPTCAFCDNTRAMGTCGDKPICAYCVGRLPPADRQNLRRYSEAL